ncbi:hypothetical protein MLD38_032073 [Melastoma candidum]|uniref:Uncharacterized protein n=1 Tax=Melastoma candidum TaxID=119954 RepID=A0ACB9M2P9_9MYRT|nr:hypothetical protein MLD38_032073 [Melastoma candidum]
MLLPLLSFLLLLLPPRLASSQSFIGVNYGQVSDNLPPPSSTSNLLRSTSIGKVRLYGADPAIISALANTGIGIVIGAANGDIPSLASDPSAASRWVSSNVLPFYPASDITLISVGNEVLMTNDEALSSQLLPAMQNMKKALDAASLGDKIKVSTVHSMSLLSQSDPPSSGRFHPSFQDKLRGLLQFQSDNGSPLAINPYPFFAYQSDPRPETLAFCLFQPNAGRVDSGSGIKYMNMFDAQVDAVRSALDNMGFKNVDIMVAETGWPYNGDANEVGVSVDNARAYNGNLIAHLRSLIGTPLMPGKSVDTFIFALYDEDLKPGPTSEKFFGLYKTDLSMVYDIGLEKGSQGTGGQTGPSGGSWCVAKTGIPDAQLQASLDYACGNGGDCSEIQPGSPCFEPNTVAAHAAYAMNSYYQKVGKTPMNCDFSGTAMVTNQNPSYQGCTFPGEGV